MKISFRGALAATLLAGSAFTAVPAFAQEAPEDLEVSANVSIVSDYRFRGISFSGGDLAIQGGIDLAHSSGLYIGTWASSLEEYVESDDAVTGYGSTELDVYAGWGGEFGGVGVDVGVLYYIYPDGVEGLDTDYWEPYASISTAAGPAEVTVGVAYAFEQESLGDEDNLYVYGDVGIGIPSTPVSVSGHIGYTDGLFTLTDDGDAFDYSVGLSMTVLGSLDLGVSYVAVDGPSYDGFSDDTVVFSIGASF